MGHWGYGPIGNDRAADWLYSIFDKTKLHKEIANGLNSGDRDIIRAAAYLFGQLGNVYGYPIEDLDNHLHLALKRLSDLLKDDDIDKKYGWKDPEEYRKAVKDQIVKLSSGIKCQSEK